MRSTFPTAKLSEIAYLNPTLGGRLPEDELVSFVPMASVGAETAKVETTQDRPYSEVSQGFTPFLSGDVLVAKITPCFENGKIAQANLPRRNGFGSTEFHVVRSRPNASDARYLHHYLRLKDVRTEGQRRMTGSGGQRRVPASFLSELRVPAPPLEEQRRIAAILDQAESLRTQRRQALAHFDTLTQSLFLDMFGDPVANPKGWGTQVLTEFFQFRTGKLDSNAATEDGEYPFFTCSKEDFRIDTYAFDCEALLLAGNNANADYSVKHYRGKFNAYQRTYVLTLADAANSYIYARVVLEMKLQELKRESKGSSTKYLTLGLMDRLKLHVPDPALQQTFATRIQAIEALKATHRAALAELDVLFASLQQRAFSGELTRPVSAAQVLHTQARDFNALCHLDAEKCLESLIYVARRIPQHDLYKSLKALYFGDKHHLETHGCLIYGETYSAMQHGPVPQAAYDLTKVLDIDASTDLFANDVLRATLRHTGNQLIPSRDADTAKLSAAERHSLDWAIRYCGSMSFEQTKTASHDSAYRATQPNAPMAMKDIIRMLPAAAQLRFSS